MSGITTPRFDPLITKFSSTAPKTVSSTSEVSIIPAGVGDLVIPANWFQPGHNIRMVMRGTVSTALVAGLATIRVKVGGSAIASNTSGSILGSLSGQFFKVICNLQCYTTGTAGTFGCAGEMSYPVGIAGFGAGNQPLNNTNVVLNTTVDQTLDLTAQWSLSGNSVSASIFTVEMMRMQ